MADYKVTDTELTSIANAIRTKGGTQAQLVFPTGFVSAVQAIPTGGGGAIDLYPNTNPDYYMDFAGLICKIGAREFYKTNAIPAFVAWFIPTNGNSMPLLVSTDADAVKYTAESTIFPAGGSFTYKDNRVYYYNAFDYGIGGISADGFAKQLVGSFVNCADAALALLNLIHTVIITANGLNYIPNGYNGFGNINVMVSGTLDWQSVIDAYNTLMSGEFNIFEFYYSATNPTGQVVTYSDQQSTCPAWTLFKTGLEAVTNEFVVGVRWTFAAYNNEAWVQLQLPEARKINGFGIANVGASTQYCKDYKIQGSNDGQTYTDIYSGTLENIPGKPRVVTLEQETAAYSYYKIIVLTSYSSTYKGLSRFWPMYLP